MTEEKSPSPARRGPPPLPHIDIREHGAKLGDVEQAIDRRMFFQLMVFRAPVGSVVTDYEEALCGALQGAGVASVVYADVNDPRSLALLTWSEDPGHFVAKVRPLFAQAPLRDLTLRPDMTMLGRTYGLGYEQNLAFWLLEKPVNNVLEPKANWAVWYPLRRSGEFEKLDAMEKRKILGEHGTIGRAYGAQGLASDVRIACHGLDANDNEFVIGLIGDRLHPLSHVVQSMRGTRQTSEFIAQMGPFFVGHAVWKFDGEKVIRPDAGE